MAKAFLVFPHQLFKENVNLNKQYRFYLVEDSLFFSQYNFHKQKLILHRASMKYYEALLIKNNFIVNYLPFDQSKQMDELFLKLVKDNIEEVYFRDVADDWLEQRLYQSARKYNVRLVEMTSPTFLSEKKSLVEYFSSKSNFFMADFYIHQRKKLNILMEGNKPLGGKWSFDIDNRKKIPKTKIIPPAYFPPQNEFVKEAINYIQLNFFKNYGNEASFDYAVTHEDAQEILEKFLNERFVDFGTYEDAILKDDAFIFHSVLSPYLNNGLLTPLEVLEAVLDRSQDIPINSKEGFLRQIIGWREYMRAVYIYKGRKDRTHNFWEHKRKIPQHFWNASTGILPVDNTIHKILNHAYSHHIERLMIIGNFMLLCEFDPDEIYRWFMEMYVDAYDWVMVPNVYSMSQYSGGGSTTTKPYISSSNYILKMSDYKKDEWAKTWDALYWRFIHKHLSFFQGNPRLSVMAIYLQKKNAKEIKEYYTEADHFLNKLGIS